MAQKVDKKELGRIMSGGENSGAKFWKWLTEDGKPKQEKQAKQAQETQEVKRPRAEAELPTTRY